MVSFAPVTFVNLDALAAAAVPFAETQFAQDALPASSIPSADAPFWNLVEAAISDAPEPCGRSLEEEEKDSRAEQRPPSGDTVMPPAWLHLFALPASEPVLPYSLAAIGAPTEDTAEEPEGDGIVQPVPASRDGHFRIDVPVSREPLVRWRADVAYAELEDKHPLIDAPTEGQPLNREELSAEATRTPAPPGDLRLPEHDLAPDIPSPEDAPPPERMMATPSPETAQETPQRAVERTVLAATLRIRPNDVVHRAQQTSEKVLQEHRPSADLFKVSPKSNHTAIVDHPVSAEAAPEAPEQVAASPSQLAPLADGPPRPRPQEPSRHPEFSTAPRSNSEADRSAQRSQPVEPAIAERPSQRRPEAEAITRTEQEPAEHRGQPDSMEAEPHAYSGRQVEPAPHASLVTTTSAPAALRATAGPTETAEKAPVTTVAANDGAAQVSADDRKSHGRAETISIRVEGADHEAVEVRFQERRGEVHLSLRASASETVERIRENLPELSHRLQAEGFDAKTWRPDDLSQQTMASESHQDPRHPRDEQHQRQEPEHRRPVINTEDDSESFVDLFDREGNQKWQ